jgi:hypothetical protein
MLYCKRKQYHLIYKTLNSDLYSIVRKEIDTVDKYYKSNVDAIMTFWLSEYEYDMKNKSHRYLLSILTDTHGTAHPIMKTTLDAYTASELGYIGLNRYTINGKAHYRIYAGDRT